MHRAEFSAATGPDTDASAAAPREDLTDHGKAASALVNEGTAVAGTIAANQPESSSEALRLGYPVENLETSFEESVYGAGSSANLHESTSATAGINPLKTADGSAALSGLVTSISGKVTDKQLEDKASMPESTIFQSSASSLQGNDINLPQTDNSAQNALAYDPYHMAEFVQDMREQFTGSSGRQLTLEMEPGELGKISLKVEAKKDEISVVAMTDNESAKQALMRHSPSFARGSRTRGSCWINSW